MNGSEAINTTIPMLEEGIGVGSGGGTDAIASLINVLTGGFQGVGGWILGLASGIVILMIIWGGFQYMSGNTEAGKKTLLAAVVGLIIIGLASWIVQMLLGGSGILTG